MNLQAPVILFVYNRPWHTQQMLDALRANTGIAETDIFVFADGPKKEATPDDQKAIQEVRALCEAIDWAKSVTLTTQPNNVGLANHVIFGINTVFKTHDSVIVLEDDIVTHPQFLSFINNGLALYQSEDAVFGISGYTYPSERVSESDSFFLPVSCSWSYATWKDRWRKVEFDTQKLIDCIHAAGLEKKMDYGDYPFYQMLCHQAQGEIDSWAIRFYASMFLEKKLFLYPKYALIRNIGFDNSGTHSQRDDFFSNELAENTALSVESQQVLIDREMDEATRAAFKKRNTPQAEPKKISLKKTIKRVVKKVLSQPQVTTTTIYRSDPKMEERILFQNGQLQTQLQQLKTKVQSLKEVEFKVFSQWGDDGIIQYLIRQVGLAPSQEIFVEFGVEDYKESNTRFLLMNNNWKGLVMDGSEQHIERIKKSDLYWKYSLTAKSAFITQENINELIESAGIRGEIGLLHIDIDGNDYWIWKALTVVAPVIMIVEYNSVFGDQRAITVPYKADFERSKAHYSHLYAGASLGALIDLASERDYVFVGSNSAGNNAYFVKKAYATQLQEVSLEQGYVASKFRESRNQDNELNYLEGEARIESIKGLPIFNTKTQTIEPL